MAELSIIHSGIVGRALGMGFEGLGNKVMFYDTSTERIQKIHGLGLQATTELREFISLIEEELGKRLKSSNFPISPEMCQSHMLISPRQKKSLNYNPKTRIKEGLANFVEWYKNENPMRK